MRKKRRHKEKLYKERLRAKIVKKENERKEAKLKVVQSCFILCTLSYKHQELLEGEPELS